MKDLLNKWNNTALDSVCKMKVEDILDWICSNDYGVDVNNYIDSVNNKSYEQLVDALGQSLKKQYKEWVREFVCEEIVEIMNDRRRPASRQ